MHRGVATVGVEAPGWFQVNTRRSNIDGTQADLFDDLRLLNTSSSSLKPKTSNASPTTSQSLPPRASRFLSVVEVAKRYGVNKSTVWRWVSADKNFPEPIKLSKGTSRWGEHQLLDYEKAVGIHSSTKAIKGSAS